jgi:hypothetical protein
MNNRTLHILSIILTILFCWIIYPFKWIKLLNFKLRKANAIRQAEQLTAETNKQVYVVQYRMRFKVGLRSEFRKHNSQIRRDLDKEMKGFLDYDYRNGIIYHTK